MKTYILTVLFALVGMTASAMSFERAQEEALYLTDKMAYELNLNDQQYNDAYEINLDYFLSISTYNDLGGVYYKHRLYDLRCIMHDWQYDLLMATDYFLRPILWHAGSWFFPIYTHYARGHFYFGRPGVYISYRGGHGHYYHSSGFYTSRRPVWNGGLRGHDMGRVVPSRRIDGRGYHFNTPSRGGQHGVSGGMRGMEPGRGSQISGQRGMEPGRGSQISGQRSMDSGRDNHTNGMRGQSFDNSSSRISRGGEMSNPRGGQMNGSSRGSVTGNSPVNGSRGSQMRGGMNSQTRSNMSGSQVRSGMNSGQMRGNTGSGQAHSGRR